MKKSVIFALSLGLMSNVFYACGDKSNNGQANNGQANLSNVIAEGDSLGLAMGILLASNLQQIGFTTNDFKSSEFIKGFEAAANGRPTMADTVAQRIFQTSAMAMQNKAKNPAAPAPVLDAQLSEAFGNMVAPALGQNGLVLADINLPAMQQGIETSLAGKPALDLKNAQRVFGANPKVKVKQAEMQAAQAKAQAEMQAKMQIEQPKLEKTGVDFLKANKSKKGVQTTASGLQYQVIKEGSGKRPTLANTVKVHYHGTLIDGKVFDSSVDRGEPIEFPLGGVIPGWQEGVALMSEGSKYKLFIPHQLGYGGQPSGAIPAFSTLIFDVELIAIVK
jgi:FKBP-type peptidyl-prolyl cis-trans isomerase